jgi:pimeloyl-ACP methyl ester carboxylesterase
MNELPQSTATTEAAEPEWFTWALGNPGTSHFIEANDNRLHFLAWNYEREDLPTLIFVHGFRGHARWWDFIAPFFAGAYRIIALDLSGMGDSGHRPSYGPGDLANDVIATIEATSRKPVIAIGHSYGGSRVLRACADRPELFEHLIIVDSYVLFEDDSAVREPAIIRGDRQYPDEASAIARFKLLPSQPYAMPCLVEYVARHSLRRQGDGYRWKFDPTLPAGGARETDGGAMLGRVVRPVDYICGGSSAVIKAERAERMVAALPDASGPIVIPNGYHHLMFDQPIALISTLRALLARRRGH